jgi:hypothetical protein
MGVALFDAADYDDADDLRAQLVGWDREITLLEPGPLAERWWQASLGDVVVADGWLGRAVADWSTVVAGRLNFVICLAAPRPVRWCGLEGLPGDAIVGAAGRDYHALLPAGLRTLEFIVPEALFPALRSVRGGPGAHDFSPRTCHIGPHENEQAHDRQPHVESVELTGEADQRRDQHVLQQPRAPFQTPPQGR